MNFKKWVRIRLFATLLIYLAGCQNGNHSLTSEQTTPPTDSENEVVVMAAPKVTTILTDENIEVDTSQIIRTNDTIAIDEDKNFRATLGGIDYVYSLYENKAYQCGATGNYTFFVMQRESTLKQKVDNWVFLRGGGIGYYYEDEAGDLHYLPAGEGTNVSPNAQKFMDRINAKFLNKDGSPQNNVVGRRLREGSRVISVAYCDHDIYAGTGHPYPNNPFGNKTVDGLTATMSAILYANEKFPTQRTWLHGTSAGSAGSYNVSRALTNRGFDLAGVLLDSFTLNSFSELTAANQCKPYRAEIEEILGLTAEDQMTNIYQKALGTLDPDYIASLKNEFLENYLGDPKAPPYFVIQGANDDYCCGAPGRKSLSPDAEAMGGNCQYVNSVFDKGLNKGTPSAQLSRKMVIEGRGHVVSLDSDPIANQVYQIEFEKWIQEIRN